MWLLLGLLEITTDFKAGIYTYFACSHSGMTRLRDEIPRALALIFYSSHKCYGIFCWPKNSYPSKITYAAAAEPLEETMSPRLLY